GETHHPGERVRTLILDVREMPHQIKIVLSRSHPDFIRRLFELEVPEVAERIIEAKALAREAGYRTKIAVSSIDSKVDAVGACVGVRGSRIKNIVDELGGEKIDIVRWNESSQILITNSLKPAEIQEIALCFELGRATVVVAEDQLSLAIGKRGQNVRLAARLTGWDIDILTPAEYNKGLDDLVSTLKSIDGVEDVLIDKLMAMGIISLADLEDVGSDPLVQELELSPELAEQVLTTASEAVKRIAVEQEEAKKRAAVAAADAAARASEPAEPDATASESDESAGEAVVEDAELAESAAVLEDADLPTVASAEGNEAEVSAASDEGTDAAEADADAERAPGSDA
ncbi:MAG: transcription termination/antitermination protein NusA, partial [Phycisphaerae bacterium]|nr:transcription termination/antitermination protein NusA [Phycisphaerae bacterium]